MAKHKLASSSRYIQSLISLGTSLGYEARGEYPAVVPARHGLAVDVAWLRDDNQRFPLMIFEIESAVTNAAANNPVKVFGQPNENYEKPLFFFHIFSKGGGNTSRIDALKGLFGTHNYRTYCLERGESKALLLDVISQHRRLAQRLDLVRLVAALESVPEFAPLIDDVLRHAEHCRFRVDFIINYARLAMTNPQYKSHFLRRLQANYDLPREERDPGGYGTYVGGMWTELIHLGVLHYACIGDAETWAEKLRDWQERSSYLSQIGPHLGLSYDYDQFVMCLAPPLCAFAGGLFRNDPGMVRYFASLLWQILDKLRPSPASVFNALWLLYLSAAIGDVNSFESARLHINDNGGIAGSFLESPPSIIDLEGESEWYKEWNTNTLEVPSMEIFLKTYSRPNAAVDGIQLAIEVLTDDNAIYQWSNSLLGLLFGRQSSKRRPTRR